MDVEEGEIRDSFGEKMVAWSDEGLGSAKASPIMCKNELKVLPPVPPVAVNLQPCHRTLPIGVVSSVCSYEGNNPNVLLRTQSSSNVYIVGAQVIIELTSFDDVRYNSDNE